MNYELSIVNYQLWIVFSDAKVSIFVIQPPSLPHEKARKTPISEKNLPPLRSPPLTCHVCFAIPRFSNHPYPLFQGTRPDAPKEKSLISPFIPSILQTH